MTGETTLTPQTVTNLIDIGAVVVVLLCAAIGSWRGLFRMLTGLAVLILSLIGAVLIATNFSDPLTDMVTPVLESRVTSAVEEMMSGQNLSQLIGGYEATRSGEEETLEDTLDKTSFGALKFDYLSQLFDRLTEEHTLPQSLTDAFQERLESMRQTFSGTVSQAISTALKEVIRPILYGVLLSVSFVVLSFVLRLVFKSLDGMTALPGLHSVNAMGGMILGLVQGFVILVFLAFLLRFVLSGVDGVSDSRVLKLLALWFPSLAFP